MTKMEQYLFSCRLFLSFLVRIARFGRRRCVVVLVGCAITFCTFYVTKFNVGSSGRYSFFSRDSRDIWIATEESVNLYTSKLRRHLSKKFNTRSTRNDSSVLTACNLPSLDPFHASVKPLIKKLDQLDCGVLHSSFENNILRVKGEDVVSVKYRIITRPEFNDFDSRLSDPVQIDNMNRPKESSNYYPITPGKNGCIMHKKSKKCLHPSGGKAIPIDGEQVVFHSDCCFGRIQFRMTSSKAIRHVPSGLCLHVNEKSGSHEVRLEPKCSTKFQVSHGVIRVAKSKLCLQAKNNPKSPENEELVVAGKNCKNRFYFYETKGESFEGNATVNADFVRVDITRTEGKESITEVHMQTAPKPEVLKRKVKPAGIPVNIAMIMFDSTSAANFIRQMPKTREFLKTKPTVYLEGETIVGDGTTAQLCAMLTGIAEEEQPEARRSKLNAKVVDDWRWIFRDYKNRGYVTMYSEDSPHLGTFNLRLKGFRNPPTDHYGRPFWFEADKHAKLDYCSTNQPLHKVTMKFFLSLFRSYPDNPKFSFLLFSDLTHGNMNALKYGDEDLTNLLKTMDKESHLDDTIVFIFGDHGVRFGEMRKTLQGKLEERLPHMSITFPTWFPKKHPKLYKNVQQNAKLLTTPFDIYVTLQHILTYPVPQKDVKFGKSLFIPIDPEKRTCASSGVEEHWCPCMNLEKVPVTDPTIKAIASYAVDFINKLLLKEKKAKRLCRQLSLKEIKTAFQELPNEKVQTFKQSSADHRCDSCGIVLGEKDVNNLDALYQIQFITSPNNGFFEASIRMKDKVPSIKGAISRVDTYGNQPHCIEDTHVHLMKFCYCKKQIQ